MRLSTLLQRIVRTVCACKSTARMAIRRYAASGLASAWRRRRAVKRFKPITTNAVAQRNRFCFFFLLVREPKRVSLALAVIRQFITNRRGRYGKRRASVFMGVIALEKTCQKLFGDSSRGHGHGGRSFSFFFFAHYHFFFRFSRSFVLPLNANPLPRGH